MNTIMTYSLPLLPGETPIDSAPSVTLDEGVNCIPQHFLLYQHTLSSIQRLISDVDYDSRYLVFVDQQDDQLFLQIGVLGYDNYVAKEDQSAAKLVYGRRWRIELNLPTSEIIQTAFLALQKAREHEVRELFRLHYNGTITTPFSNHHDLPLLASQHAKVLKPALDASIKGEVTLQGIYEEVQCWLTRVAYNDMRLRLTAVEQRKNGLWLIDIDCELGPESHLPEWENEPLTLMLDKLDFNGLCFSLMDIFLQKSNRHVEEHFQFQGFPRFSRRVDIRQVARLSVKTRGDLHTRDSQFKNKFTNANYETDQTRVPRLHKGKLADKITQQLLKVNKIDKFLPRFATPNDG